MTSWLDVPAVAWPASDPLRQALPPLGEPSAAWIALSAVVGRTGVLDGAPLAAAPLSPPDTDGAASCACSCRAGGSDKGCDGSGCMRQAAGYRPQRRCLV